MAARKTVQSVEPNIADLVNGWLKSYKKPWYAGQFVRKIIPKIEISEKASHFFTAILNKQKTKMLSVLVRNVDQTFKYIQVPVKDGKINFEFMSNLISAIQKLIIRDVVSYSNQKLAATK